MEKKAPRCARCGSCTAVCPVYRLTGQEGHSARGKLQVLDEGFDNRPTPSLAELLGRCLMCGACEVVCPRGLPLLATFAAARGLLPPGSGTRPGRRRLLRVILASPRLMSLLATLGLGFSHLASLPADSGLWRKLGVAPPEPVTLPVDVHAAEPLPEQAGGLLFAGCLARHLQPEIVAASRRLAAAANLVLSDPAGQGCCGLAAWSAGDLEGARHLARRNIALYRKLPGPVLTPCVSCQVQLLRYRELLADDPAWSSEAAAFCDRVRGVYDLLADALPVVVAASGQTVSAGALVYHHESCHLRLHPALAAGPRRLLAALADIRLRTPAGRDLCCGQGGLFQQAYPALSMEIFSPLYQQVAATGVELVITGCSGCLLQWQTELAARQSSMRVLHLAVFLAQHGAKTKEKPCSRDDDLLKLPA